MKFKPLILLSVTATVLFYLAWWNSSFLPYLDYKLYDKVSSFSPHPDSHATVVVEIDEESLHAFGQWPWPRIVTAEVFEKIAQAKPAAIVADLMFSEQDRTSPAVVERFYHDYFQLEPSIQGLPDSLRDNDAIIAERIGSHRIVLPIFFQSGAVEGEPCILPSPALTKEGVSTERFYTFPTAVCNLPVLQKNAGGVGHIHASADSDGILRRLPLFIRYSDKQVPILGLAAIGSVDQNIVLKQSDRLAGDIVVEAANHRFAVDQKSDVLVRFYPESWYERISVLDLMRGDYNASRLQGKFVFVGSNAIGLDSWYTLSDRSVRAGIFANATLVENFFNDDLGVQPSIYPVLNLSLSLLIALALMVLMVNKQYVSVIIVFFAVALIGIVMTFIAMSHHIYPSIGYLIVPLLSYLFVLSILMFYIDYRDKKKFVEDILYAKSVNENLENQLDRTKAEIDYQKEIMFHQSKLAAMGEMIGNIAHQWRQPLTVLSLKIQDLEDAYSHGEMDKAYIDAMIDSSLDQIYYMSKTVDDFRDFLNPNQTGASFNLLVAVNESVRLLSSALQTYRISCEVRCKEESIEVFGVTNEFKQVIINLINNTKDVLVAKKRVDGKILILIESDAHSAMVRFEDNGGGIPPSLIHRIFEPYVTTKTQGEGSGIGLYMSHIIISAKMGGSIEASNTDSGAQFLITLPLQQKE